jgi:hypothetical protein
MRNHAEPMMKPPMTGYGTKRIQPPPRIAPSTYSVAPVAAVTSTSIQSTVGTASAPGRAATTCAAIAAAATAKSAAVFPSGPATALRNGLSSATTSETQVMLTSAEAIPSGSPAASGPEKISAA